MFSNLHRPAGSPVLFCFSCPERSRPRIGGDEDALDGHGVRLGGAEGVGAVLVLDRLGAGDLIDDVHALVHLAEDRVGVVQIGRAARTAPRSSRDSARDLGFWPS